MEDIYLVLAQRLREERARAGLTLDQLAERASVTGPFVAHIEKNRKKPSLTTVQQLAKALDLPISELLKESPQQVTKGDAPYVQRFVRLIQGKTPHQKDGLLRILKTAAEVVSHR